MDADNEIARSLGRLEGKVDQFVETMKVYVEQNQTRIADIEKRVGRVEKKSWYAAGAAAAVTFLVTKLGITDLLMK